MDPDDIQDSGGDDAPEVSHPSDPNPVPGHTEYLPIGEPKDGDIYIPSGGDDYTDAGGGTYGM